MPGVTDAVIECEGLSKRRDGARVLEDVGLTVEAGEFVAVIGPSGGGKTTLIKLLLGLLKPDAGSVRVFGDSPQSVRAQIGYSPQESGADREFPVSVLEVVCMGALGGGNPFQSVTGEHEDEAHEIMAALEIEHLAGRGFGSVSGGEMQRVLVARALMGDPELLLLDEVASEVDVGTQHVIFDCLTELNGAGKTILLTSHDLNCVMGRVPRTVALNRTVLADGPTSEVLTPESVEEIFETHYLFAPTAQEEIGE